MTARRRLAVLTTALAERHPDDGWVLADPVTLGPASARVLHGLVLALLPPPPAPRPEGMEARIEQHLRRMLAYLPPVMRLGFVLLTHVLDWAPLWRFKSNRRVQALPAEQASAILAGIATSRWLPIRLMMLAPKALILSTYYDQDEVHAALNYAPTSFIRERVSYRESLMHRTAAELEVAEAGAAE